jgi:hypothetical protein
MRFFLLHIVRSPCLDLISNVQENSFCSDSPGAGDSSSLAPLIAPQRKLSHSSLPICGFKSSVLLRRIVNNYDRVAIEASPDILADTLIEPSDLEFGSTWSH